jgi:hypothetical protein
VGRFVPTLVAVVVDRHQRPAGGAAQVGRRHRRLLERHLRDPLDHLPWLPLPTPFGPISLRHLLAHAGGIVAGLDASPSPIVEALTLGQTAPGWPAGERVHYSNVGYGLLGLVLERSPAAPTARPSSGTCSTRAR